MPRKAAASKPISSKMRAAEAAGHEVVVVAPGRDDYEESKFGGRIRWVKGPECPLTTDMASFGT